MSGRFSDEVVDGVGKSRQRLLVIALVDTSEARGCCLVDPLYDVMRVLVVLVHVCNTIGPILDTQGLRLATESRIIVELDHGGVNSIDKQLTVAIEA